MRKILYVIFLAPILFSLACNLQMPNAVQVKGSPDFRFSAKFKIDEYLADLHKGFEEEKDGVVLLDCEKTDIVTYLVYMRPYDQEITLPSAITSGGSDFTNNTGSDIVLVPSPPGSGYEKLEVPALDFSEFLQDFSFDPNAIKSKLYISGSPIVNGLSVELKINGGSPITKKGNTASGLKTDKKTYDKTTLPEGGVDIEIPFNGDKIDIEYKIFVAKNDKIEKAWMTDLSVLVEVAVLLPFKFIATKPGAEVKLPEDLFPDSDLFGREKPSGDNTITDMLESLSFAMKMNKNPFKGAKLVVESREINIVNPIGVTSLEFAIDEKTMKAINTPANFPFTPSLKLVFDKDGGLYFPRDFFINEISFKAKINHTIDLPGGKN
jgi:hypothetical protein